MHSVARPWIRSFALAVLFTVIGTRICHAEAVILAWDQGGDPSIAGYVLAIGTSPGAYSQQINVGKVTEFTIPSLTQGTYYFAVRAYTSGGASSGYSNEVFTVIGSITVPPSSGCPGADPFAAIGGGICVNGGWLPPGMTGTPPPPAPPAAPSPAPPATHPGCSTPDPFASMGGGTCHNGGWLPPGMVAPSPPPPAPAPVVPPPAPPASAPPATHPGCSTPDPFASMGGGTCHNGGWLPPGMLAPSPQPPAPAPVVPPPTPPPSAPPATHPGCSTPDPFASMGGGTCHNGGWLPPGMVAPSPQPPAPPPSAPPPTHPGCSTPDPFASMGGGTCHNGGWLPPGMVAPSPQPPAATPVVPPPAPPPSAPPPTHPGCSTPDPFASMGGGTCHNGGWLPPGMLVPGSAAPSAPPAAATPAPAPSPGQGKWFACQTPDPFVALGGGTCVNGGWLPPGMASSAPDGAIVMTGTLRVTNAAQGLWVIDGDDGTIYVSPTAIPAEMLLDLASVTFSGYRLPVDPSQGLAVVEILFMEVR